MQSELQCFGQVDGLPSGSLEDLLPATEPIGDNQCIRGRVAHRGQQHTFADRLRHRVLLSLEAKGPRHPAAPGVDGLQIGTHPSKQRFFIAQFHDRFVMAVSVQEHLPAKLRRLIAWNLVLEKLAEEKRLTSQPGGARIRREQIAELIAKDGSTTRLQHDDWDARINLDAQGTHDSLQVFLGSVEHAEIVQRSPAAQMNLGDSHLETRALKYFQRRAARIWMKIIVKRVRPQNNLALVRRRS